MKRHTPPHRYYTLLRLALVSVWVALCSCGCTSTPPKLTRINGKTIVQTDRKVFGVPVWTSESEIKTHEQQLEDLEIDKERREQDIDLKAEERQSAAAFWMGMVCISAAGACVVIGYIAQGWRFWGGLALTSATMGVAAWSFEHLIPHLKWGGFALGAAAIGWTMWKLKDFSLKEHLKRKQLNRDRER